MKMSKKTGLNTVILNFDGSQKKDSSDQPLIKNYDVFDGSDNNANWNGWADWVNKNAVFGDIVAVASWDAIGTPPTDENTSSAAKLLKSIGAYKVFQSYKTNNTTRTPYALLFIKGRNALEILTLDFKTHAVINTNLQTLLNPPNYWIPADLTDSWILVNPDGKSADAQYSKNMDGIVFIEGFVKGKGTIFTLKEGFRPLYNQNCIASGMDSDHKMFAAQVVLSTSGDVLCNDNCSNGLYLSTISFRAAP